MYQPNDNSLMPVAIPVTLNSKLLRLFNIFQTKIDALFTASNDEIRRRELKRLKSIVSQSINSKPIDSQDLTLINQEMMKYYRSEAYIKELILASIGFVIGSISISLWFDICILPEVFLTTGFVSFAVATLLISIIARLAELYIHKNATASNLSIELDNFSRVNQNFFCLNDKDEFCLFVTSEPVLKN